MLYLYGKNHIQVRNELFPLYALDTHTYIVVSDNNNLFLDYSLTTGMAQ